MMGVGRHLLSLGQQGRSEEVPGGRRPLTPEARAHARRLTAVLARLPAAHRAERATDPVVHAASVEFLDALDELSLRPGPVARRLVHRAGLAVIAHSAAVWGQA